jgi:hypothetical protein
VFAPLIDAARGAPVACHCFLSFAVAGGGVPRWVLGVIYELAESRTCSSKCRARTPR